MNCRRVEQLLSNHIEARLAEREAGAVAVHLQECPACRRRRDAFIATDTALRALPELPISPELRRRAIEHWSTERQAPAPQWRRGVLMVSPHSPAQRAWLGTAAAVFVVLLFALAWWTPRRFGEPAGIQTAQRPSRGRIAPPSPLPRRPNQMAHRVALRQAASPDASTLSPSSLMQPRANRIPRRGKSHRSRASRPQAPRRAGGDLTRLNEDAADDARGWISLPEKDWGAVEARLRREVCVRDDFVRIPFPRLADATGRQMVAAVEGYQREAAIVDPHLAREVTLQQKAIALADFCDHLRADTGIVLTAGSSVADEKVTVFCEKLPLREVMRQLSRPFGYTWLRSGKQGEYKYELVQDLRSQLLEEELRNRDRNAALLALEKEIERYRPYLALSPDEALARSKTAPPADKWLLEKLAGAGWGVVQIYYRLSAQQLVLLRAGQRLTFSAQPKPGEQPMPPDLARGVLQSFRGMGLRKDPAVDIGFDLTDASTDPQAIPVTRAPAARAAVFLSIGQSELGQLALNGQSSVFVGGQPGRDGIVPGSSTGSSPYAVGVSPTVRKPDNGATNVKLARDPALRPGVTVLPQPSCPGANAEGTASAPKVTTADVLEAVHRVSGLPIVSDYYTRLCKPEAVSVHSQSLFDALNQVADAMRLHWNKDGNWLQFRSASYYDDRLKEVPNCLLVRWAAIQRQHGMLPLEELTEIAQLTDAQLDGAEMAEGARDCFGLQGWELARNGNLRPHLRYLATFTPDQRRLAMGAEGLPFTRMTLAQQQRFLENGLAQPIDSLEELAGAALRVEYTQPGEFQWQPGQDYPWWLLPVEPGPQGRRALLAPIRARTREAALEAARRIEPQLRDGLLKNCRYYQRPTEVVDRILRGLQGAEVVPTRLDLEIVYFTGTGNRLLTLRVRRDNSWFTGKL